MQQHKAKTDVGNCVALKFEISLNHVPARISVPTERTNSKSVSPGVYIGTGHGSDVPTTNRKTNRLTGKKLMVSKTAISVLYSVSSTVYYKTLNILITVDLIKKVL